VPPSSVRRVVTGINAAGKSVIIEDAPVKKVRSVPERPGYVSNEVWITRGAPVPIDDPDRTADVSTVAPVAGGTILRVIEIPPEPKDPVERERGIRATFGNLYKDAEHRPSGGPHPGMHVTDTVDYALVLSGEIWAVMDEGETLLKAGDVLIQRGTNHAWANRSSAPCRVAFILIDGRRAGR
jgi:hypothetical protein